MSYPIIICDQCEARFEGSEDVLTLRNEARDAGWTGPMDAFPPSLSRPKDLCPSCQPQPKAPT